MIEYLSLFSGIGAFEKALERQGIPYNLLHYCEIDKFASKSYSAIHKVPETLNLWDITKVKIDELPQCDLITYGFPCQDISLAGKQKGFKDENGNLTRSGLFFYAAAIIGHCKPKVAIAENVKALTTKKFTQEFGTVLDTLTYLGYNNYWKVLNAKDYGIPQNRERVFIVSVREDVDSGVFEFPSPFELTKKLKDVLETNVDEKYYLSDKALEGLNRAFTDGSKHKPAMLEDDGLSPTIDAQVGEQTHRAPYVNADVCHTVRAGGHGSTDRHSWDMVKED